MTTQQYYEQFNVRREVYEEVGGNPEASPGTLKLLAAREGISDTRGLTGQQRAAAREMELAALFIHNADRTRYCGLQATLKNEFLSGNNNNPATVLEAYTCLTHWKEPMTCMPPINANDGVAFTTTGKVSIDSGKGNDDGITLATNSMLGLKKEKGTFQGKRKTLNTKDEIDNNKTLENDISEYFPTSESHNKDKAVEMVGSHVFNTSSGPISPSWILLDNQSSVDVFCESSLLGNIRRSGDQMKIQCNAGTISTTSVGDFKDYGTVWYCNKGIANILSFANASKRGFEIAYDEQANTFTLKLPNGRKMLFKQSTRGLYYHDTKLTNSIALINTVESNKGKYSHRDYLCAKSARDLLCKIGPPSLQQFLSILDNNQLPNCPVTRQDALIAEAIFGPDLGSLKGKTSHRPPEQVQIHLNDLPADIMKEYCEVTLCGDIMYVNKIPFLITISRHIHFGTVEMIANRQMATILKGIKAVISIYRQQGFTVKHILLDGEFEPLREPFAENGIQLNTATNNEHVPEIERYIRTLKEFFYNTLPFEYMAPRIIIEMVKTSNFWLNAFPYQNSISKVISPRQIITGSTIDYNQHCNLAFGAYVQTHEAHDNTMVPRTTGALALRPTGNVQGGFYFYSLSSGCVISRNRWTELPKPNKVIHRIHVLARRANAARGPLAFLNRYGISNNDDNENDTHPGNNNEENDTEDESYVSDEVSDTHFNNNTDDSDTKDESYVPAENENEYDNEFHNEEQPITNYQSNAPKMHNIGEVDPALMTPLNNNTNTPGVNQNQNNNIRHTENSSQAVEDICADSTQDIMGTNITEDDELMLQMDTMYGPRC
jgi:hypothetical protein